jgi:hypothetical protein
MGWEKQRMGQPSPLSFHPHLRLQFRVLVAGPDLQLDGEILADYQSIDINDLEPDLRNYRLNPQPDQRAAMKEMIELQGPKLVKLAKDILDIGVSPFDLTLVTKSEDNPKLFTVLEGNRRLIALRCIHEPELASGTTLHRAFLQLAKSADSAPYELYCAIAKNKAEVFEFIRRKHDTGLEGAGTETWTAVMKERAAADQGRGTPTHHALEFVAKNATLDPSVKEKVDGHKFPITNLRRFLESTARIKSELGFAQDQRTGSFKTTVDKAWTLAVLTEMVNVVATGSWQGKPVTVRDFIDREQRETFLVELLQKHPKPARRAQEWNVDANTDVTPDPKTAAGGVKGRTKVTPHTNDRKTLIPPDFRLQLPSGKANDIYDELRKLEVKRFPNAVAILFRVFVEFSAESYIKRRSLAIPTESKLIQKLKGVTKDMEKKGVLSGKEMAKTTQLISNPNSLVSTFTLNQYVHNQHVLPGPSDLNSSWSSVQLFIEKCWTS